MNQPYKKIHIFHDPHQIAYALSWRMTTLPGKKAKNICIGLVGIFLLGWFITGNNFISLRRKV